LAIVGAAADIALEPLPVCSPDDGRCRLLELCAALLAENEQLWGENGRLRGRCERLTARVCELERKVEELRRAAKRQAAPFSRGERTEKPGRPGRRPGAEYGRKAHRPVPDRVDETLDAPLEDRCECGGEIELEDVVDQYQEELPEVRPIRRRFRVYRGRCSCCGRRHQGRHPFQTSDALGAAGSMLGSRAVALATQLNKELGLSPQKTAKALARFGIQITAGGVVQAVARQARALEPTYGALIEAVRASAAVSPDETGWRVAGRKAWLSVFVGDGVTVYLIAGRGYEDAERILGENFSGVLERDGWAPYRRFANARHQSCAAHLLRRCQAMIEDSIAGQARVPHQLRRILKDALLLRDREATRRGDPEIIDAEQFGLAVTEVGVDQIAEPALALAPEPIDASGVNEIAQDAGEPEPGPPGIDTDTLAAREAAIAHREPGPQTIDHELARSVSELEQRIDALLAISPTHEPNRRLLKHLANEREHLLTFLKVPGVQATNWRSEQALRPAIVNRKSWGGNRTWNGARTQQVTMSVIRTARQQQQDPIELMAEAQLKRTPTVTDRLKLPTARSDPTLAA
jgi:transposase